MRGKRVHGCDITLYYVQTHTHTPLLMDVGLLTALLISKTFSISGNFKIIKLIENIPSNFLRESLLPTFVNGQG